MIATVMIPEERKSVLIGKDGIVKKFLEEKTKTKVTIELDVSIEGESLDVLKAQQIVKAIGRGFSPEKAFLLLDDEYQLNMISLSGETPNTIKRLFARVIGRQGKTRRKIEQCTGAYVSVYGKTVSIIGKSLELEAATKAIGQLLEGRSHGYVYRRLEHARK
jgi:ribosomal RNA assembly protein